MHEHARKHAKMSKHVCVCLRTTIPERPHVREKREPNTAESKRGGEKE